MPRKVLASGDPAAASSVMADRLGSMSDEADRTVVLDERERRFLRAALLDWGGPANPTDDLAVAMGFSSAAAIAREAWQLWEHIEAGHALSTDDWRRVLLAAEVVFASDVVGSGVEWASTSGLSDIESVALLRRLQRKLPR